MNNPEAITSNRFHTSSTGPDEAALRAAFHHCGALLQARCCSTMALAVHTKNNLDGVIRNVFGDTVIRVLDQENRLDLNGCCRRRKSVEIWRHKTAAEFGVERLTDNSLKYMRFPFILMIS